MWCSMPRPGNSCVKSNSPAAIRCRSPGIDPMTSPAFSAVQIAVRTLIALVFLTAAVGKMRHWAVFQGVVANYRLLPDVFVAPVGYCLPPFELLLGAMLLFGLLSPFAEGGAAALLLLF